jgi:hypothetical protein
VEKAKENVIYSSSRSRFSKPQEGNSRGRSRAVVDTNAK